MIRFQTLYFYKPLPSLAALCVFSAAALCLFPAVVSAEPETVTVQPIDVRATSEQPAAAAPDRERSLDEPAFATTVRVDQRAGETTTLAEVLSESTGVRVRSLGGLGSFSSISVRGGAPGHTALLVDGIAVSRLGSVGQDLSQFELTNYSELQLYRGGVPIGLGGAAMAGALNMTTRVGPDGHGRRIRLSIGGGSFGARHVRARYLGGRDTDNGSHVSLAYGGSDGDFRYFNDNGTNLNTGDDAFVRRQNNGYDRLDAVARLRRTRRSGGFEVGLRALAKRQGVAGTASRQSMSASLTTLEAIADARITRVRPLHLSSATAKLLAFAAAQRQGYRDLKGEIGVAVQDRVYDTLSGGVDGELMFAVGTSHIVGFGASVRGDVFAESDNVTRARRSLGGRVAGSVSASEEWVHGRLLISPALRLDVLRTMPIRDADSPIVGPMALASRTELHPSPRIAGRWRVGDDVSVKSSAGWYFRAPTATELFGDRGYFVGNPSLRAETGVVGDIGAVFAPSKALGALDRVYVETVAFAAQPRNAIVPVPTAGLVTVPQNLGHASLFGVEATGSLRFGKRISLVANYTLLFSRQDSPQPSYDGKALPQRPVHDVYSRIDLELWPRNRKLLLWLDARLTAGNFLDRANIRRLPSRQLIGAGVKWQLRGDLVIGVEGKNLAHARVENVSLDPAPRPDLASVPQAITEFAGYPLPGRAFYASVEWNH